MRLTGIDLARYAAFVGMVLVNFRIAAEVVPSNDIPSFLTNALEGRAAALFVVLAGIGISLGQPFWHLALRRALFLFVIGMVNMTIFEADILHYYALYFIVAIPFLTRSNRALLIGTAGIVVLGFILQIGLDYDRGWDWNTLTYADFWSFGGFLRHSLYNGWHPVLPWVAFLLWGMWLGRLDLGSRRVCNRLLGAALAVAILAQLVSSALSNIPEIGALLTTKPIPPGPFYMLAAGATATAFIALILRFVTNGSSWTEPFIIAGRHTLSHYVGHILIGMGTLEALGLLTGVLTTVQIFWISIAYCIGAALFSLVWSRMFRRGPLEALMRLTTEGKV